MSLPPILVWWPADNTAGLPFQPHFFANPSLGVWMVILLIPTRASLLLITLVGPLTGQVNSGAVKDSGLTKKILKIAYRYIYEIFENLDI